MSSILIPAAPSLWTTSTRCVAPPWAAIVIRRVCSSIVAVPSGATSCAARTSSAGSCATISIRSPPTCDFSSICRTARDDPPLVDDRDLVRELVGLLEVLGGEEQRRALAHLGPDHVPHAESAARVEPGRRLVEEEDARPAGQRRREVEPPAHPARVGLGDAVCGVLELEALEQLVGARAGLLFREVVEPSEHPEVLASGQVLVHGRVLAGEADRLAHRLRFADDVEARHACAAGIRLQQRREDADGRRLAGPIRPEQAENGAFLHLEVDAVERAHFTLARAVDLDETFCFNGGHAC